MAQARCPVCGASVRAENLTRHLDTVHPREATAEQRRTADRQAARAVRTRPRPTRPARIPWFAVAAVAVVVIGLAVAAMPRGSPPQQDVLEMCVNHTGIGSHTHATLQITILGTPFPIPADIGVTPSCMRPLHTHDATGTIHMEFPSPRDATLGDFFRIWGKVFTTDQLMDYRRDATHTIDMTVNAVPSTAFASHVLGDGQLILLEYEAV
jgi:hypothetical protein